MNTPEQHVSAFQVIREQLTAAVEAPAVGFRTFYGELDYSLDGLTYRICTQVRVLAPGGK